MKRLLRIIVGTLVLHNLAHAQPVPDRETLAGMFPEDAVVLDLTGAWSSANRPPPLLNTKVAAMDERQGHPRMVVATPGGCHSWKRALAIPFDPQRYPIAVLTYRATGILPSDQRLLWLDDTGGAVEGGINVFYNGDLVADGEIHEVRADLLELRPEAQIVALRVYPQCKGPQPAVFELLGLRFESEHELPPLDRRAEPDVTVRVLGEGRAPIEGAMVTMDAERLNWSRSTKTDAAGTATVRAMTNPFGRHVLRITKEGMVPVDVPMSSTGTFPGTVRMVRGAPHSGVVLNEEGKPVANASVEMRMQAVFSEKETQETVSALTDTAGRWHLGLMPKVATSAWITLQHPDYVPEGVTAPLLRTMHDGTAKLVIRRGLPLRGLVVAPDGGPIPQAHVSQGIDRWLATQPTIQTDDEGQFIFPHCAPGKAMLTVQFDGLAPALVQVDVAQGMEDVIVALAAPATILGRVVDADGKPLAGVRASVTRWQRCNVLSWHMITAADGRFEWDGAPAGPVSFSFRKSGYLTLALQPLQAVEGEQTITLLKPMRVQGTITDAATGEPVENCTIMFGTRRWRNGDTRKRRMGWERHRVIPCKGGQFSLTVPKAYYVNGREYSRAIRIDAKGYATAVSPDFTRSQQSHTFDLKLSKDAGLTGAVLLPDGRPAGGATVLLYGPGPRHTIQNGMPSTQNTMPNVETKADGTYWFAVPEGEWRLAALHPSGYAECTSKQHAESPGLELQPWARIEGVYRVGKKPIPNKEIIIPRYRFRGRGFRDVPHSFRTKTDDEGRFVFARVPAGKGMIGVKACRAPRMAFTGHGQSLKFAPGEVHHVQIGGTGRPVIGKLVLAEGVGADVAWSQTQGDLSGHVVPQVVDHPEQTALLEIAKLPPAERIKRLHEWMKSNEGKALAEGEARKAVPEPQPEPTRFGVSVGADGSFRIEDIPAGSYTLGLRVRTGGTDWNGNPWPIIGTIKHQFTVPEMNGGRSDEPLDLGKLIVVEGAGGTRRW